MSQAILEAQGSICETGVVDPERSFPVGCTAVQTEVGGAEVPPSLQELADLAGNTQFSLALRRVAQIEGVQVDPEASVASFGSAF